MSDLWGGLVAAFWLVVTADAELMEIADDIWLASYDRVFSTTDVDPQTQVIDLSGATPIITSPRTLDFSTQLQEGQALVDVGGNEYISYFENRTSSTATPFLTMESFKIERRIDGDGDANTLNGSTMDDILDGKAAADTMNGDKGNDTYVVDDAADNIVEEASEGDDTVYTTVSYDVPVNVEVLIMSGSGNLRSNGTEARDIIIGNVGNNTINGGGDGFLAKPVDAAELFKLLAHHLQLEWVFEEKADNLEAQPTDLVLPAKNILEALLALAKDADMVTLETKTKQLLETDISYKPFVASILKFTEKFMAEEVEQLLQQYLAEELTYVA